MAEFQSSKMMQDWKSLTVSGDMKTCGKCGEEKDEDQFAWRNDRQTFQHYCRECQRAYRKKHYDKNRQKYIDKAVAWKLKSQQEFYEWLRLQRCVDCETTDWRVFELDHLYDKEFTISNKIRERTFSSLILEIEKCDVVCANCHRIRTLERSGALRGVSLPV